MRVRVILVLLTIATFGQPGLASGEEEQALTDLVQILRQEGVIDDEQYVQLSSKAEKKQNKDKWYERFSMWGDLRLRWESFFYDRDATGNERDDRNRLRYRLRLNTRVRVNDRMNVLVRLATGASDSRSGNQTLGSSVDFDPDNIAVDRAYLLLTPFPKGEIPGHDGYLAFEAGKVPNPFRWKIGQDLLLWDRDINLEGGTLKTKLALGQDAGLFFNTGYYVIDENSTSKDPGLFSSQLGGHLEVTDEVEIGSRVTLYRFNSLDSAFFSRSMMSSISAGDSTDGGGNFALNSSGNDVHVLETGAYLKWAGIENWPLLVYGNYSNNLDASSVAGGGGDQENAFLVGMEVGDAKAFVKLGMLYARLEANAFPSMYVDSDLFDGFTNRKGWAWYLERAFWENAAVKFTAYLSDEIKSSVPPYGVSVPNADRLRIQADVALKF